MLERKQYGVLSLNLRKLEIRVEDFKITLILQKGKHLLTLFLIVFLNQVIIYQEMVKL